MTIGASQNRPPHCIRNRLARQCWLPVRIAEIPRHGETSNQLIVIKNFRAKRAGPDTGGLLRGQAKVPGRSAMLVCSQAANGLPFA
jgi:hypothetical protein